MHTLFIALFSIALSVAAQFALKAGMASAEVAAILARPFTIRSASEVLLHKYVFSGFVLYALGAAVWLAVLAKWDVSKAYPLVGLGFVMTLGVGALLGEQVTTTRVLGVVLISLGVWFVART